MAAHQVDAPFGIPLLHQDDRHGRRARYQDGVEQPGHMGQGGRHQGHVGRGEAVGPGHRAGLVGQAPLGVEHGLRVAGRARGEQDHGHVGSPGRTGGQRGAGQKLVEPGIAAAHPDRVDQTGQRLARRAEGQRRSEVLQYPGHLGRSHLVVDGRGHRPGPPARPEQHQGLPPVGQLPGHHVAPLHTAPTESPGHGGHQPVEGAGVDADIPVHHGQARGVAR
jgi:hypothetical protein